jgi:hypothetical protein
MPERWIVLPEGAQPDTQASYSQILAVHAALLHTGKVLMFGGSEHVLDPRLRSIDDPRVDNTRLWDPATGAVTAVHSPQPPPAHLYDLFCCGHALLADGRLLVGGGTSAYPPDEGDHHHEHYRGSRRSSVFDPATGSWSATGEMIQPPPQDVDPAAGPNPDGSQGGGGRWYPTLVLLPDRTVVAFGGHPQEADLRHSNYSVEVWGAGSGVWRWAAEEPGAVQQANNVLQRPEVFPRAHVLPNGRVFLACLIDGTSYSWDPYQRHSTLGSGWDRIAAFPAGPTDPDPNQARWDTTYFDTGRPRYSRSFFAWSSVLLPLLPDEGYRARVLIVGRRQPHVIDLGRPDDAWPPAGLWQPTSGRDTSDARLFNPSPHRPVQVAEREFPGRGDSPGGNPTRYSNVPGMRQQGIAVLLPDGTVLVVGGSTTHPEDWSGYFFDGVMLPEVFEPATGQWRTIPSAAVVPRVYHGVALLLPDGRVWTAGSNPWGDGQPGLFRNGGQDGDWEERIEVFEPWYFSRPRPQIVAAPEKVRHGQSFEVQCPQSASVSRVAMIRAGSTTHGQIIDQRYVGLRFEAAGGDRLRVWAPPQAGIAPPGYYLLVVVDAAGVPSVGRFVRVELGWEPWFALGPSIIPAGAPVAALSLAPGATSLYATGQDTDRSGGGRVLTRFFPDRAHGGQWSDWLPLGDQDPSIRPVFPVGAPVAAISSAPGATSLYVTGLDNERLGGGKVYTKFFPDRAHPGDWSDWLELRDRDPSVRRVFPVGAPVAAVSAAPGATSLYVVGLDNEGLGGGKVYTKFFPDGAHAGDWSDWLELHDRDASVRRVFPVGAPVAAVSAAPGATSLYVVGLDNEGLGGGKIYSKFFPDGAHPGDWSDWLELRDRDPSVRRVFPVGAPVTAVSTARGATSLYVVGLDNEGLGGGKVYSKFFPDPTHPNDWSDWFPLGSNVFPVGAPVTALSMAPGATSLYLVGIDGQVWSNFFPSGGRPEWSGWFALGPNTFPQRSIVAAVSTGAGETSLFVVGLDGQVWSTYFDPSA